MPSLPTDPITGQSGPYNPEYLRFASNVRQANSFVPYSPETITKYGYGDVLNSGGSASTGVLGRNVGYSGGGSTQTAAQIQAAQTAAREATERANTVAQYDDYIRQYNAQLGQLDPTQNVGLQNIGNSYNLQANRLDEQLGGARRNYDLQGQQNTQSYQNTRNNVMTGVRSQANALQRLLGMAGSGNSSAALEQAPYAAARMGSQGLSQAQQTYGSNARNLDIGWQDTDRSYRNNKQDLETQKYQQENSLRSSISQTRASLLDKIRSANINKGLAQGQDYRTAMNAAGGQQNEINGLLAQITQLGQQYQNPVLRAGDVSFKAPSLSQYSLERQAAPTTQGGAESEISPSFLGIMADRDRKREPYGNIIA